MKISESFMIVPLLAGILLTACTSNKANFTEAQVKRLNDSIQSLHKQIDKLMILDNLFNSKDSLAGDEDGREVEVKNANLCINFYPTEMGKHGLRAQAGTIPSLIVRRARKITTAENFQGRGLLDWLIKTVDTYDPQGKGEHIRIKLVFGIYTPEFLANEQVGNELSRKKIDRVGVFLVPYSKATNKPLVAGDGKVYDLGGLDP
ncbi:hypothetical protein [Chitinophaga japonensis]|uniref:Uncharacterized protein n=1 Tax=Chitinophaga japonensis TaxID=104662 RepID=A0A562SMQ6_CHIJA|nr:hypothetical protein [Chitinophaga japonensis]TWI81980.1 hypothetical protein LX66_5296 [Chitinophaga japonensis]